MIRIAQSWIILSILIAVPPNVCNAIQLLPAVLGGNVGYDGSEEDEETRVLKIYQVGNVINSEVSAPFSGLFIPGASKQGSLGDVVSGFSGGFGGGGGKQLGGGVFSLPPQMGGGGFGGGGGGFGGGGGSMMPFQDNPTVGSSTQNAVMQRVHELMDVIFESVAPNDWDNTNGENTMVAMGELLIVTCPESVHEQIDALLTQLSQIKSRNNQSLAIEACWVFVDENEYRELSPNGQTVDQDVLARLMVAQGGRARINCQNRQTVHIISGNLTSEIESVIPVVGGISNPLREETGLASELPGENKHLLAQIFPAKQEQKGDSFKRGGTQSIGYQPVPRWVNYGGLLQVSPIVQSENKVFVNLSSVVILRKTRRGLAPATGSIGGVGLSSQDFQIQQFRNSAVLPMNKPVVVGGSTIQLDQNEDAEGKSKQLYLILKAGLNDELAK